MNDYFGAHMSIAGGIHLAPERGVKVGCAVIQVFTQNSNQWRGKPVSDYDALLFKEKWCESGLQEIVSHDIYLVNLAAAPGETREKSLTAFREEMERCSRLGITKIIMHPGAHLGDGEETGIKRICEAFNVAQTPYERNCLLQFVNHLSLECPKKKCPLVTSSIRSSLQSTPLQIYNNVELQLQVR